MMHLRKQKGLSQEDVARFLEIPRSSVAQIELGKRSMSALELIQLSDALEFSLDAVLASNYKIDVSVQKVAEPAVINRERVRVSTPKFNLEKLENVVLYILEKCAAKPNVSEAVFNKLLYFVDFNCYEIYEEHLTGVQYRKFSYGPVPQEVEAVLIHMIRKEKLQRIKTEYQGYPQIRYIPLVKAKLTEMTAAEKDVIDKVIERFSDWSASAIREYALLDMPLKATENGEIIDCELAFYREATFSVRTYD